MGTATGPSPDPIGPPAGLTLTATHQQLLLDIAETSITTAFEGRPPVLPPDLPLLLAQPHGAFVTLHIDGRLNGCIGEIEGREPLAGAVARLARSAAFEDPRLPPARATDLPRLAIHISVLSPLEPVPCADRAGLLAQVDPGTHGLLLGSGRQRGVFLPDVWAQLPDPDDFLDHLLAKASLHPRRWPAGLRAWRFTTHGFTRHPTDARPPPGNHDHVV